MSTDERLANGTTTYELQRTAPPVPEACPIPRPRESWRTTHVDGKLRTFATPKKSLTAALDMIRHGQTRLNRAVVQLAQDGWADAQIAAAARMSEKDVHKLVLATRSTASV